MVIPYVEQPSITLGPLTVHAFGAIVAVAAYTGLAVGARRFARLGLDRAIGERMAWWAIVGGFLGAHLFSVLFYFPEKVVANPLVLFKLWEDISSFGGILGGSLALWLFFRVKMPALGAATRWAYLDVVAFAFPIGLMIGRIACSLAHDHPGTITSFPLAVSLKSSRAQYYIRDVYASAGRLTELPPAGHLVRLGFNDLGWYELLYLAVVIVPVLLLIDRRPRRTGTFLLVFIALYMPVRFLLDFLRVSDVRYLGYTPAQWVAALAMLCLPMLLIARNHVMTAPH